MFPDVSSYYVKMLLQLIGMTAIKKSCYVVVIKLIFLQYILVMYKVTYIYGNNPLYCGFLRYFRMQFTLYMTINKYCLRSQSLIYLLPSIPQSCIVVQKLY